MKITTDNLTGYDWHFETDEDGKGWYVQKTGQEELSRLSLNNFPDPNEVWQKKITKSENVVLRSLTEEELKRLKPRQYIFDLWEHRLANHNA